MSGFCCARDRTELKSECGSRLKVKLDMLQCKDISIGESHRSGCLQDVSKQVVVGFIRFNLYDVQLV